MPIRVYLDEDAMARAFVQGLRARGVDVTTAFEEGVTEQDDRDQLVWAAQQERVLYTFNVGDFCRLHAEYMLQGKHHAGIVVVPRQRYTVGEQIRLLLRLLHTMSAEEMRDRLEFL
jgi:hypothetical protein